MSLHLAILLSLAASSATPTDGFVSSRDGVRIAYHAEGSGSPAIVFVHCWACDRHLWDKVVPEFAARHRVATLDLAGHGSSGRGRKAWTMEAYGDDVNAVADALKIDHAILVGHSMGGPVILAATVKMPARVVGLVPVDTLLDVSDSPTAAQTDEFLKPFRVDFKEACAGFIRKYMVLPTTDPGLVDQIVAKTQEAPPEAAIASLRSAWLFDAARALSAVKVPIHALNADHYPTNLAAERKVAPQFEATLMTGVGHYLMLEDPTRFTALLKGIVDSMVGASRGAPAAPSGAERP